MAIKNGTLVLLKLDDAGGTPSVMGGSKSCVWEDTRQEIDTSNKSSGDDADFIMGRRSGYLRTNGYKDTGDAVTGTIIDAYLANTLLDFIWTEESGEDKFSGQVYAGGLTLTANDQEPSAYDFNLRVTGSVAKGVAA